MRIIRRDTYRRMPWKNGQGMTEEIMTFPDGSDVDGFDGRVSIAHVGADGPFSLFAGVDRTIALIAGRGLLLDLPGNETVALTGEPYSFPGDWAVSSRNLDGPTMDLNVMTRRGRYRHSMTRETIGGAQLVRADGRTLVIPTADMRIRIDGSWSQISGLDMLELWHDEAATIDAPRPLDMFVIVFTAVAST